MFNPHPSSILTEHFRQKPHQGADPRSARFLFVGLDANYAADVEASPIFPSLLRYHTDGPEFWRCTGTITRSCYLNTKAMGGDTTAHLPR